MSAKLKTSQLHIFEWIEKVIVNYKKLSKANLTYDHTKKRLDELEERAYEEVVDFLINALSKFDKASIPRHEDDTNSSFLETTKPSSSQLSRIGVPKFSGVMSE